MGGKVVIGIMLLGGSGRAVVDAGRRSAGGVGRHAEEDGQGQGCSGDSVGLDGVDEPCSCGFGGRGAEDE